MLIKLFGPGGSDKRPDTRYSPAGAYPSRRFESKAIPT